MKFSTNEKRLLMVLIVALAISLGIVLTSAFYPGSHSLYLNKTATVQSTAAAEFCVKCHAGRVASVDTSVHRNAGCICHGYNPNLTAEYNINLAHNLTKDIYCTNCHSGYNVTTGAIDIHGGMSGLNQSAHYILQKGDRAGAYMRAKQFFDNMSGG